MIKATLAEQTVVDNVVNVELVQERVAVLADRRGKDDNFVELTDALHELINTRAFDDVDIMVRPFNFDRDSEIGLMEELNEVRNFIINLHHLHIP